MVYCVYCGSEKCQSPFSTKNGFRTECYECGELFSIIALEHIVPDKRTERFNNRDKLDKKIARYTKMRDEIQKSIEKDMEVSEK